MGKFSDNSIIVHQIFQSSILPPSPNNVMASAINTADEKLHYSLSSQRHKKWLPSEIQNNSISDLQRIPRNYIKWDNEGSLYQRALRRRKDKDHSPLKRSHLYGEV